MSRKFLTPIDLNGLELQNARIHNLTADPTAAKGRIYFDSVNNVLKVSLNGSTFSTISTGGGSFTLGSTLVNLGDTVGTIAGLTSVTSTTFVGNVTGTVSGQAGSVANALTLGSGLTGTSYNGASAVTATVDTSIIATKAYVDGIASGVNAHDAVKYATTGALGTTGNLVAGAVTTTYNNNTTGVGATITIAVTGGVWTSITIDGQSLTAGDRVLIKNQAADLQNGIYTVTTVATLGSTNNFVFTRAADNNEVPELGQGDLTYVIAGTNNGGNGFIQTSKITTIGTDAVTWSQFSGSSATLAGLGLVTNGNNPNQIDVNPGTGIAISGDTVAIDTSIVPRLTTNTNAFVATTGATTLAIRLGATQGSTNLTEWTNNANSNTLALVTSGGSIYSGANGAFGSTTAISSARLSVTGDVSKIGVIVRGNATTPGNLQEWQTSTPSTVASVDATGVITALKHVTTSGTSSQFVKGDGSLDSGVYLTSAAAVTAGFTKKATNSITLVANTQYTINHALATQAVLVQMFDSSWNLVDMDVLNFDANNVKVTSQTAGTYNYVIIG
jgi:hypothetical protein